MRKFVTIFALAANLALADAVVKEIAVSRLDGRPAVSVIPGLFDLALVRNMGCAWGMLQGHVWPLAVFGILAMALLVWKRRAVFSVPDGARFPRLAKALCAAAEPLLYAGIVGNLLDRVVRGHVIDMLDFHWGVHHFPCFNLADAYISVAAAFLIAVSFMPHVGAAKTGKQK